MQEDHSDHSGVAQHALVLGASGHVQPNPTELARIHWIGYKLIKI